MKKYLINITFYISALLIFSFSIFTLWPYNNINASIISDTNQLTILAKDVKTLKTQADSLSSKLAVYEKTLNELEKRISEMEIQNEVTENYLTDFYINKLKDPSYVSVYNNEYTYYTAAENLGMIGKSAIPPLIKKLNTPDDYERALVLYSLLLASQSDSVRCFCGNDYIHTNLDFDARNHPSQVKIATTWWEKYKNNF